MQELQKIYHALQKIARRRTARKQKTFLVEVKGVTIDFLEKKKGAT